MGIGLMMLGRNRSRNENTPHQTYGRAEGCGDLNEDMELRRRRNAYERGYEDAMIDNEARRRRNRGVQDWGDSEEDMEMRRRRRGQMGFDISPKEAMQDGYASVKKLAPNLEGVLEDAVSVASNPPQTWPPYLQRGDVHGIAKMEGKELMKALEEHKPAKDIRKELVHTIAALMLLVSQQ